MPGGWMLRTRDSGTHGVCVIPRQSSSQLPSPREAVGRQEPRCLSKNYRVCGVWSSRCGLSKRHKRRIRTTFSVAFISNTMPSGATNMIRRPCGRDSPSLCGCNCRRESISRVAAVIARRSAESASSHASANPSRADRTHRTENIKGSPGNPEPPPSSTFLFPASSAAVPPHCKDIPTFGV